VDLALARIRDNIGQLRGPVQRSARETLTPRIGARVKVAHLRYYLGAALMAALAGIAVNALLLQRERHPAPLFGYAAPKPLSAALPAPAPAPAAPQKPASAEDAAADPIGELLAGEPHGDAPHLVLTAQTALAKLGYPVKADGKEGAATEQALRDFEHAHGLAPATEITERLVRQLTAAARAGAH
jgi:hypothetical protein